MCTFHFPNLQNNPCLVYGAKKKFAKHVCFKFNLPYNKVKYSTPFQATFSGYTNTFFHWINLVIQIFFLPWNKPLSYCSVPKVRLRQIIKKKPKSWYFWLDLSFQHPFLRYKLFLTKRSSLLLNLWSDIHNFCTNNNTADI